MKQTILRILRYYGEPLLLERQGVLSPARAFLRPVTSKSWQAMRRALDELGEIPQGQYLFIGPADCQLETVEAILCREKRYLVKRAELLTIGGDVVCTWGLCQQGGPSDAGTA